MPVNCPACDKPNDDSAQACRYCGQELDALPPPPPPKREMGDGAKYAIIIGVIVVVGALILFATGLLGGGEGPCKDCKGKGTIVCPDCHGSTPVCKECKSIPPYRSPNTSYGSCPLCDGGKKPPTSCKRCGNSGRIKCTSCQGSGQRPG